MAAGGLWPLAALVMFWGGMLLVGYTLIGYGAVARLLARVRPRPVHRSNVRPIVTVVVVAYNEGGRIAEKIENLLSLDYPRERLDIVIASDGSTDDTVLRARAYEPRVRVVACHERRGKPAVLNQVVPQARGTVVVLADTRQRFDRDALTALVQGFADPVVGAVSGELILLRQGEDENVAGGGAALYWDREKKIRFNESVFDSTIGATGAIYAVRRDLFEPIPPDTILDDVLIPMRIARQGYRVLFEPSAKAFDHRSASARQEFVRKVRTIAGNFQLFARERWLLNPFSNRLWFQTLSHKGLRLLLPVLFLGALTANCFLLDSWVYRITLAGQLVLLAVAAVTSIAPAARKAIPGAVLPYTVCFLCFATIVGFLRFVSGRQAVTWDRSSPALDPR
jgi:cellulose synthase/poly-beta-1,6-N-acetylglucosamine synthase-like glycosyltransferase